MKFKVLEDNLSAWWLKMSASARMFLTILFAFADTAFIMFLHYLKGASVVSGGILAAMASFFGTLIVSFFWTRAARNAISLNESNQKLALANEELQKLNALDPLTGVYNRSFIPEATIRTARMAAREKSFMIFFMIDIDLLSEINDTFGHPAGDEVLKTAACKLEHTFRASDFIIRMGGDEFGILAWAKDPAKFNEKVSEKLKPSIIIYNSQEITVSMSYGFSFKHIEESQHITISPEYARKIQESLYHNADEALYERKMQRNISN